MKRNSIRKKGPNFTYPDGGVVLGIDPGFRGAFIATDGINYLRLFQMPILPEQKNRSSRIDSDAIRKIFTHHLDNRMPEVFLERAIPMAMGSRGAFTFGRGYEAILIGLEKAGVTYTEVEPSKWAKEMHHEIRPEGLKPKVKSLLAVEKYFPQFLDWLPRNKKGVLLDGPVDALLIAAYGLKVVTEPPKPRQSLDEIDDFF